MQLSRNWTCSSLLTRAFMVMIAGELFFEDRKIDGCKRKLGCVNSLCFVIHAYTEDEKT